MSTRSVRRAVGMGIVWLAAIAAPNLLILYAPRWLVPFAAGMVVLFVVIFTREYRKHRRRRDAAP